MKVNIKGVWYDAENEPILIELNPSDKRNLQNMHPQMLKYIAYPDNMSWEEVQSKLSINVDGSKKVCSSCNGEGWKADKNTGIRSLCACVQTNTD